MNFFSDSDKMPFEPMLDEDSDFIPLLSAEDEDTVLFPGVVIPITVGRDRSIRLVHDANKGNKTIAVVAQKNPDIEVPGA